MLSSVDIRNLTAGEVTAKEQEMLAHAYRLEALLDPLEPLALYRLCAMLTASAKILEIGSYKGGSAVAMGHAVAHTDKELYCLDPWLAYLDNPDFEGIEREKIRDDFEVMRTFISNTEFIGENLRMLRGKTQAFAGLLAGKGFDLIFIDGAHDYESVRADIKFAFSAIRSGGIICGHDYQIDAHGVLRAVNELIVRVATIKAKGTIRDTSIWCCVVDNPTYEFAVTEISDLCNAGKLVEAQEQAQTAYARYGTEEIQNYLTVIASARAQREKSGQSYIPSCQSHSEERS
jgi:predicted O-methyltransferase YrrM